MTEIVFEGVTLHPIIGPLYEWCLTTAEVAAGFGVEPVLVRQAKSRMITAGELIVGRHIIEGGTDTTGCALPDRYTRRGIVRLGFNLRSERARRFRDFAEDLIIEIESSTPTVPKTFAEALMLAATLETERVQALSRAVVAEQENVRLGPLAAVTEDLLDADGSLSVREAAQSLSNTPGVQIGLVKLMALLRQLNWVDKKNAPYQNVIENGRLTRTVHAYKDHVGETHMSTTARVTSKGLVFLHDYLARNQQQLILTP
jgi:phage antirepressor YoqD-like protein